MDDMLCLRLRDCGESTRKGMTDRGFPVALARLCALGLVEEVVGGYKITEKGLQVLQTEEVKRACR